MLELEQNPNIEMSMEPVSDTIDLPSGQGFMHTMMKKELLIKAQGNTISLKPTDKLYRAHTYYLLKLKASEASHTTLIIHS